MNTKEKYEKAVQNRDRIASGIKGGMTQSKQNQLDDATDEVIRLRKKLIETGQWEGPIPIPVKAKYRGR